MSKLKLFFLLSVAIFIQSCTSESDFELGKEQLEQQGYTEVVNTGYNLLCCSEDDSFSTGFECKDRNGRAVTGCFCSSFLKGVTIRFE